MKSLGSFNIIVLLLTMTMSCSQKVQEKEPPKPNILFIAVDDLRLQANVFGQKQMKTPNLDRLAAEAVVFERAYCSVPVCGASRASLLTGVRPTATRFVKANTRKDKDHFLQSADFFS